MPTVDSIDQLTDRQRQVAQAIGNGKSYREAAEELDLSIHTVRGYTRDIAVQLPADPYGEMTPKTAVTVFFQNANSPTAT